MSLRTALPRAWANQAPWLFWLRPLSALYAAVTGFQRLLYRLDIKKAYESPVPVMVIGNITVGGSGKTPLLIELVRYLQQEQKLGVGVISRGYGGEASTFPRIVHADDSAKVVGDEPLLIVQQTGVPMAVGANRQAAIECLLAHVAAEGSSLNLILSDDGLQHLALGRKLEWIVLDANRGIGKGWLLPAGFLRESPDRLNTATVIEHSDFPLTDDPEAGQSIYQMRLIPGDLLPLDQSMDPRAAPQPPQRVHAVAGIGNPARFFTSLRHLGFDVIEHAFADHHPYQLSDVQFKDTLPIITTAKDAQRLQGLIQQAWILPVKAWLSPACYSLLYRQLLEIGVLPDRRQIQR
ncbi:tetraacyldisaccharide 4'-kinase [Aquirhabdus parva]|uniref:Tetraacyldisaccharide 4'-kinase n=1 Tax=Aquirhabdus parva TaxID=2283318 RepID=A0A345P685_9GAMM|nr:tetraacyldisaccharide 4'-kinase [Aquirhabdus parva]AXI02794.1 tetraacyldisaccharide 4'-kinase [Aquirhabdus parva]